MQMISSVLYNYWCESTVGWRESIKSLRTSPSRHFMIFAVWATACCRQTCYHRLFENNTSGCLTGGVDSAFIHYEFLILEQHLDHLLSLHSYYRVCWHPQSVWGSWLTYSLVILESTLDYFFSVAVLNMVCHKVLFWGLCNFCYIL